MTRGLRANQEQDPSKLIRDVRPLGQKISDFFDKPGQVAIVLVVLAATAFYLPGLADVFTLAVIVCFLVSICRRTHLPFKMPQRSGAKDYNDMKPGTRNPKKAGGIYFFGNEKMTNEDLQKRFDSMSEEEQLLMIKEVQEE